MMREQVKVVLHNRCPRCQGLNTRFCERDGGSEMWECLDCQAKDPDGEEDGYTYFVIHVPLMTSVEWWTDQDQVHHEITDVNYLKANVASELRDELAWIIEFIEEHPEWDQEYFREGGEAHAESDWFDRAKSLLKRTKVSDSHE